MKGREAVGDVILKTEWGGGAEIEEPVFQLSVSLCVCVGACA